MFENKKMHKIYSNSTKKQLGRLFKLVNQFYGWYLRNSFVTYQPEIAKPELLGGIRSTSDRWNLIKKEINHGSTVLDIGCAEGFFTLLTARDLDCLSIGIEADERRLSLAQYQLLSQSVENAGFIHAKLTTKFLSKMPEFDYVIFLSVFHHITAQHGLDYAKQFLAELRLHTKKVMFFETGLSIESTRTTHKIPDMGEDYLNWLKKLILSAGWSQVEIIGESLSYAKDAYRPILKVFP